MELRVMIELSCADGTKQIHDVARGGGADRPSIFDPLGLTLNSGRARLASVERHLVQAWISKYGALRRRLTEHPYGGETWQFQA